MAIEMNRTPFQSPHNSPPGRTATLTTAVVSCADGHAIESDVLDLLEELDDAIFAALDGDAEALDRSLALWRSARDGIHRPLVEESRRQYTRRAESIWQASQTNPGESLAQAFAAQEVLGLVSE